MALIVLLLLIIFGQPSARRVLTVGDEIAAADVTEFYYTVAGSTNPPDYQRYRFSVEDGRYLFYHETRAGDHWPLTEADITVSGSKELTAAEWAEFWALLDGGQVRSREDDASAGGSGPWLYLYWQGDRDRYQQFSFADAGRLAAFEDFCRALSEE